MKPYLAEFFAVLLSALFFSASFAEAAPPRAPSIAERFKPVQVKNANQLPAHLSETALQATLKAIERHKCPLDNMRVYRNPRHEGTVQVITVGCYPSLEKDTKAQEYYAYVEYPLTLIVQGDEVAEVDLSSQGFMYESGRISFITDLDRNNMLEFWLSGDVCECDGEPDDYGPNGCDCNGGKVLEYRNGVFQPWKKRMPSSKMR